MDNKLSYTGYNLVFIVGCPRSGTTWLQRLMACHPKINTSQESNLLYSYIGPQLRVWRRELDSVASGRGGIGLACYFSEEEFLVILREYMIKLLQPMVGQLQAGEFFLEKTPLHALYLPEIIELLPESHIIHILRDPRDVVASLLAASKSWGKNWAPKDAVAAGRMWAKLIRVVRKTQRSIPSGQFLEVCYEDLVANPLNVLDKIRSYLGIEWSKAEMLEAIAANSADIAKSGNGTKISIKGEFALTSGDFVKEPDGFIRKARPGTWQEDLNLQDKLRLWRSLRGLMITNGYAWPFPWSR